MAFIRIFAVHGTGIEGSHGANGPGQHGHRVAVTAEAFEKAIHLCVKKGMLLDLGVEFGELGFCRQLPFQDEVADFRKCRFFSELANRIAAVKQDAFVAVNEGDLAFAAGSRREAGIECEVS